ELAQFRHVLEAVFEDSLGDMAPSMRLRHQADKGSLQVGRESGMRPGRHVNRLQVPVALYPEAVGPVLDLDAGRPKLEDHGPKVGGLDVFEHSLTACGSDGECIGPRLDVVRDHAMG